MPTMIAFTIWLSSSTCSEFQVPTCSNFMARGQVSVKAILFGVGGSGGGMRSIRLARPVGETILSHGTGGVLGSGRCPLGGAVLGLPTVCHQNRGMGRDFALLLKDRENRKLLS